jgi:hypothetical protein
MTFPIKIIKDYCIQQLDLAKYRFDFERYSCLPLCAVDMIFSTGVTYNIARSTIERTCKNLNIPQYANATIFPPAQAEQISVSQFLAKIKGFSTTDLAAKVFGNKLLTSARNGILKAEAAVQFLKVLQIHQVEYFEDVPKIGLNAQFDEDFKKMKGQSSGLGLRHFLMLAAPQYFVKPDQRTIRFLIGITKQKYSLEECAEILLLTTEALQTEHPTLTPQQLDYIIFHYQKSQYMNF